MWNLPGFSLPVYLISFFLLLLQLPSSYSGQFTVIGPAHPIRALVGDEIELPCRLSPAKNATGMEVGWYRPPFSRVVHLYRNGKDQDGEQAPEYRGRTTLVKEAIGEGKVALKIQHVRFSDEGGYTCFFRDHSYQEEAAMELKVEGPVHCDQVFASEENGGSSQPGTSTGARGSTFLLKKGIYTANPVRDANFNILNKRPQKKTWYPFYWINPGMLVLIAVLPILILQITIGLGFLYMQHRLRGKLQAEIENLHRTFDPHFLKVPCWKITLFVIVPVLGPFVAMIICYNWLHRRLAGQFLEELKYPF